MDLSKRMAPLFYLRSNANTKKAKLFESSLRRDVLHSVNEQAKPECLTHMHLVINTISNCDSKSIFSNCRMKKTPL